jgi:hypothetical protein
MSSSQAALSQAQQQEMNELMSEIAFQKVLLSSIDDTVENRGEAEAEVRIEIKTLEQKLRTLKRGTTTSASQSTQGPSSQTLNSTSSSSKSRRDTIVDDFAATGSGYHGMSLQAGVFSFCYAVETRSLPKSTILHFTFSILSHSIMILANTSTKLESQHTTSPQSLPPLQLQTPQPPSESSLVHRRWIFLRERDRIANTWMEVWYRTRKISRDELVRVRSGRILLPHLQVICKKPLLPLS